MRTPWGLLLIVASMLTREAALSTAALSSSKSVTWSWQKKRLRPAEIGGFFFAPASKKSPRGIQTHVFLQGFFFRPTIRTVGLWLTGYYKKCTRWAPTSYTWSLNDYKWPYQWPYKWATRFFCFTPMTSGVRTLLTSGSKIIPLCNNIARCPAMTTLTLARSTLGHTRINKTWDPFSEIPFYWLFSRYTVSL